MGTYERFYEYTLRLISCSIASGVDVSSRALGEIEMPLQDVQCKT